MCILGIGTTLRIVLTTIKNNNKIKNKKMVQGESLGKTRARPSHYPGSVFDFKKFSFIVFFVVVMMFCVLFFFSPRLVTYLVCCLLEAILSRLQLLNQNFGASICVRMRNKNNRVTFESSHDA